MLQINFATECFLKSQQCIIYANPAAAMNHHQQKVQRYTLSTVSPHNAKRLLLTFATTIITSV